MNIYYVYQYLRTKDSDTAAAGTPYYVGKGKGRRAWSKGNNEIQPPTDTSNVVIVAQNLTEAEAFELEKQLIANWGRIDLGTGVLRNQTDGGEGPSGVVRSAEWRERQSKDRKGKKLHFTAKTYSRKKELAKTKWQNPEYRSLMVSRLSDARKNITPETREALSKTSKERWQDPEYREKMSNARKRMNENPEYSQKMSQAKKNISDETRKRMSEANKKKWQDPDFRKKMSKQ